MTTYSQQRRSALGLFPDKPAPRLYDSVVEVLRVRHYSHRTEDAYVHWIRRYVEFHDRRHPRELDESDVNRFLTSLAVNEHVAASTQNQALSAILFLTSMSSGNRSTASRVSFAPVAPSGCPSY